MKRYNPKEIEPKWQQVWQESGIYTATEDSSKPKRYVLEYFPYPSGAAMHVGHVRNYTIGDVIARFHRMQGENVLYPMGWDSFGLPAENYAIKNNISPKQAIAENTTKFKQQLMQMGFSYDWSREIDSSHPEYYRWTQWFFKLLFDRGLAYQKNSLQWWCDTDKTVLANEQVEAGKCWRCGNEVTKKPLKQWFFKITDYADRLADDLDNLDWSDSIKAMQRNWIGKSKGAEIEFAIRSVCNPDSDMARSYIMGQKNISKSDIEAIGGLVKSITDNGHLCVEFPISASEKFEQLINKSMEPGFWNEYLTNENVIFIFKHKDGKLERFILNDENAHHICEIGNKFNGNPAPGLQESAWDWLSNNSWYAPIVPKVKVFTTRPDTLFGATFIVLAPEHELVKQITTEGQKTEIEKYIKQSQVKSDVERQETDREKTGVFTGSYAINPVNSEKVPIWIADYVLTGYGTGAIMAVPAHDERDHEFARKFNLPIKEVIEPETGIPQESPEFRKSIVAIVHDPKTDKYLSIDWGKQGGSLFIGGGLEGEEDAMETAIREIAEETGYTSVKFVRKTGKIHHNYFAHSKNVARRIEAQALLFELTDENKQSQKLEKDEAGKFTVQWLSADEINNKIKDELHNTSFELLVNQGCFHGEGIMVNSGVYDGMTSSEAREKIVADLTKKEVATEKINYKIRDWLISRQRYWGAPIPIVYCKKDGAVAVPEDQLPVKLPELTNFQPTGNGSALAGAKDWINTTCPKCGGPAKRETDTMDGFACSSWYFLRFTDPHNDKEPFSKEKAKFWLPVDDYIGGAEHAVMHLLYARMWTKVMFDAGLIEFDEPFKALRNQGMILAPDGRKMSKSWGNVIAPDEIIEQGYGADAIRLMELFIGPWNQEAAWSVEGMGGCFRFLQRVWTLIQEFTESNSQKSRINSKESNQISQQTQNNILQSTHSTIKKVTEDMRDMGFNTAIAALMAFVNDLYKIKAERGFEDQKSWQFALVTFTQLLAPFAPHITEELWVALGQEGSVHITNWPVHNESYLVSDTMKIVVQVNGKVRATVTLPADTAEEQVSQAAKADEKVATFLGDNSIKKTIYVPGKLINFVV